MTDREERVKDVQKAASVLRAGTSEIDEDFLLAGLHVQPYDDGWCGFFDPDYDENSLLDVVNINEYRSARELIGHLVAVQNATREAQPAENRPEVH